MRLATYLSIRAYCTGVGLLTQPRLLALRSALSIATDWTVVIRPPLQAQAMESVRTLYCDEASEIRIHASEESMSDLLDCMMHMTSYSLQAHRARRQL